MVLLPVACDDSDCRVCRHLDLLLSLKDRSRPPTSPQSSTKQTFTPPQTSTNLSFTEFKLYLDIRRLRTLPRVPPTYSLPSLGSRTYTKNYPLYQTRSGIWKHQFKSSTGLSTQERLKMSTAARRRLMRDFKRMQTDPPAGVSASPITDNVMTLYTILPS